VTATYITLSILFSFILSIILTWAIKNYAMAIGMVDTPNKRTLHEGDIPTGGGLSIALIMLIALGIMMLTAVEGARHANILVIVIILLSTLGWMDDRYGVAPLVKFIIQIGIAIFMIGSVGAVRSLDIGGVPISLEGYFAEIFTIVWIVWLVNSYNFMDGIDGLAASQSAITSCTLGIWFNMYGDVLVSLFCYVIMAASLGFLVWNWSPARIFMGDVGSVALGGVFATLFLMGNVEHNIPFSSFVILLAIFLADTTITLVRRLVCGKAVWQAHKEHYYQRAITAGVGHGQVTIAIILGSVLMAVLATLDMSRTEPKIMWLLITILVLITFFLKVISLEKQPRNVM